MILQQDRSGCPFKRGQRYRHRLDQGHGVDESGVGQVVEREPSAGDSCVLGSHGIGGDHRSVGLDQIHVKPVLGVFEGATNGYADILYRGSLQSHVFGVADHVLDVRIVFPALSFTVCRDIITPSAAIIDSSEEPVCGVPVLGRGSCRI